MSDGLRVVWLPVNQAWAIMWNDSLLKLTVDKTEALSELADLRRDGMTEDEAWEAAEDLVR